MPFYDPTPEQALAGLRAVKTVITAEHPVDATRAGLMAATQRFVLHTDHDFERLESISYGSWPP